ISYFWDQLIQRTCQNSLEGTLGGNSNIARGESAIYEMVKEPRFMRRSLSEKMLTAVDRFPDTGSFTRQVTFLPSFEPNVGYVLLQLRVPEEFRAEADFREKRHTVLEIACGAAKNKFPNLVKVIGIGIEVPKFSGGTVVEDFLLMPCEDWSDERKTYYEELNREWSFFGTPALRQFKDHVTQFIQPPRQRKPAESGKTGRNNPCPCGSGKKFKKCHGR
ncbi:MAG: SEC-C domain-containing protein, partial [Sandarakinorhabdus sp.]|nr:SEC-C domain-containing protein [Sandarakinorhabdus sp.]